MRRQKMWLVPVLGLVWAVLPLQAQPAPDKKPITSDKVNPAELAGFLDKAYDGNKSPEVVKMLTAILRGSQMGPGEGWFGPSESRYSLAWLAKVHGIAKPENGIPKDAFQGPPELFARLDRNKDGTIKAEDLDWSDDSPYVQMSYTINRIFRRLDKKGAGKMSREEWLAFFEKASKDKETLSSEEMRDALLAGFSGGGFSPGDGPNPAMLVRGLFAGEIGSFNEGPKVDQTAPNFVLKKVDGAGTIELSKLVGSKPVVLVLGNFTCGPFRSMYPAVDEIYQRYKDKANFLMVYVREAHPSDGWKMMSNVMAGVNVKQPTTFEDRVGVANQFCTKLKPNLPVVVDEISDPVGHAYSGMPARLYVIDTQGKVAFKSGRGPFGFKTAEMEQALVMSLLEAKPVIVPTEGRREVAPKK